MTIPISLPDSLFQTELTPSLGHSIIETVSIFGVGANLQPCVHVYDDAGNLAGSPFCDVSLRDRQRLCRHAGGGPAHLQPTVGRACGADAAEFDQEFRLRRTVLSA